MSITLGVDNDPNINPSANSHGIQAYIELVYIRGGNELLQAQLGPLKDALATTKNALDTLAGLQGMHNYISVKDRTSFTAFAFALNGFSYGKVYTSKDGGTNDYSKAYQSAASAYYNRPITPFFGYSTTEWTASSPDFIRFANNLSVYRDNLTTVMNQLSKQMTAEQMKDPNTLYHKLSAVLGDLPTAKPLSGDFTKCKEWVMDNYAQQNGPKGGPNISTSQGKFQQDMDNAVTAAQSMNDSNKEDVQRFLKVFEEYYKSAGAMLTAINQIIMKMAGGVKG